MKLIHLSDLHLGKRVNEFAMIEDQRYILDRILEIVGEEKPDGVIVAGDVYDKATPATDAVRLFDDFLVRLAQADPEDGGALVDAVPGVVHDLQSLRGDLQLHLHRSSRRHIHPLECAQAGIPRRMGGARVLHVDLDHLSRVHPAFVGNFDLDAFHRPRCGNHAAVPVSQPVTEGVQGRLFDVAIGAARHGIVGKFGQCRQLFIPVKGHG